MEKRPHDTRKRSYKAQFDGLIDIVESDDKPMFLVKDKNGQLKLFETHTINGITYCPPPKEQIPWLLPRFKHVENFYARMGYHPIKYGTGALFKVLVKYLKLVSQLPTEDYYILLAAWVMHTYLQEKTQYSPIILLFAVPERGKTRTGKALIYVAYRGVHVESLREAYIFRYAELYNATIFFDVMNLWGKASRTGSEDILLQRFEKGAIIFRVINPEKGDFKDTRQYKIFGPTIIATNESIHQILETRSIQIIMPETIKNFKRVVTPKKALWIKEWLVAFRARFMDSSFEKVDKQAINRLGDILNPIYQVIKTFAPSHEEAFHRLVERIQKERELDRSASFEAEIIKVLHCLRSEVQNGILSVEKITDAINGDKPFHHQLTPALVGRRLSAMGFSKARTSTGNAAIIYNEETLEALKKEYGVVIIPVNLENLE